MSLGSPCTFVLLAPIISFYFHLFSFFFFFNDTPTTEIYTLSLHDALPIFGAVGLALSHRLARFSLDRTALLKQLDAIERSEEHTSELQSHHDLVCRLLLEKKKKK